MTKVKGIKLYMSKKRRKSDEQLKRDRQISRDKRNALRKEIRENVSLHRNNEVFHVLFISRETENMEKVLFNMTVLEKCGHLINLPIITQSMIDECEEKSPNELILYYFGIKSDDIELIDGTNLLIVKNLTVVNNKKGLVEIMIRPYNEYTWYDNKCITTLYGERIFKGTKLKDFFVAVNDIESVYVFQDTITEILIYRSKENKIDGNDFLNRYMGYKSLGIECGNKKKYTSSAGWSTLHNLMASDDEELNKILVNETNEINQLLNDYDCDINKKMNAQLQKRKDI